MTEEQVKMLRWLIKDEIEAAKKVRNGGIMV
jgi:hypothetical protein